MNYRQAVLLDAESSTTAATKTIDLKGLDPISQILITKSLTNNGGDPTGHPAKAVKKVELVDGSDVLWSLTGIEAQALNYYQTDAPTLDALSYLNDNITRAVVPINFGRWLWDEDMAFDPSRFKNPQLKITHDRSLGGSSPDAATLSVAAKMFDDLKVNPFGWLMAKEYNSYSLTSSAVETIDLPTDYPMKSLTVQSLSDGKAPNAQYNKIKLVENNGKKIPLDDSTSSIIKYLQTYLPPYIERFRGRNDAASNEYFITPTYEVGVVGNPCDGSAGYVKVTYSYGGTVDINCAAATDFDAVVHGFCPHGATNIPFGDKWEANRWYDVTKLAKLELKITAGSSVGSSSTCEIVTEQFRRY